MAGQLTPQTPGTLNLLTLTYVVHLTTISTLRRVVIRAAPAPLPGLPFMVKIKHTITQIFTMYVEVGIVTISTQFTPEPVHQVF